MKIYLHHIFSIIALFQALFMAVFFSTHPQKATRPRSLIMGLMLFVFAILIGCTLMLSIGMPLALGRYYRHVIIIEQLTFVVAPLFYLYVRATLDDRFRPHQKDLLHLIPYIVMVTTVSAILIPNPAYMLWRAPLLPVLSVLVLIQNAVYIMAVLRLLHANGFSLSSFFTTQSHCQMDWLRLFLMGYIVFWLIKFQSAVVICNAALRSICPYTTSLYFISVFFLFNGIVFIALKKPEYFFKPSRYFQSALDEKDRIRYQKSLLKLMHTGKPYLDSGINLPTLARTLAISPRLLSRVINESFHKNFCDFINTYRIEESIQRISNGHNGRKNILEIAYEVGFNSKSAFNAAFKKYTGRTPREFKKN